MRASLNKEKKYFFRDNFEVSWKFFWDRVADSQGWFGWRKAPGKEWTCLGLFAEEEIIRRLEEHGKSLTADDRIDLDIFLKDMLKSDSSVL